MMKFICIGCVLCAGLLAMLPAWGAELVLPQNRAAFFSEEAIELAVAGLAKGASAAVEVTPASKTASPLRFSVTGDGSTVTMALPPYALAPDSYTLKLDGKDAGKLTVASGVRQSTMYVSQTARAWSNFAVSNAFGFGLLDNQGLPLLDVRGRKSTSMNGYEQGIATNQPQLCYMYWTGYVTHKPFGTEKSWANAQMQDSMRLLNIAVAQRLRKFGKATLSIGSLDEPGLSWGATPNGGMASGFPNWDEKPWYEAHGWKYTQDIANQSDADWMKYMKARCHILGESFQQARDDIKMCWPQAIYSTDAYALHAIMDGTDSLNQLPNDIPSSHVFFDFFGGPISVPGQIQLEKATIPQAKLAHAMNGQLVGERGTMRPLYSLLMNGMLQGGIHSNWWLNTGGMTAQDLDAVNKPAATIGPLFQGMELKGYDVAVLWSYTEIAMRQKDMAAQESSKQSGKQITLMLPLPDAGEQKEFSVNSNAYEVGQRYTDPVLGAHQVLRRAGYPAQIIDECLIPGGALKNYKVLVIMGQTFPLPKPIMDGIAAFVKKGGVVVTDKSTTVKFPGAVLFDVDYSPNALRTRDFKASAQAKAAANKHDASQFETIEVVNNAFFRQGVAPMKAALVKTPAKPVVASTALDLSVDKQTAGQGALISVLNGHEELPQVAEDKLYPRYNPASYTASYTLPGLKKSDAVYCIEGIDWMTTNKLTDPTAVQEASFAPGEMKLYLVAPKAPSGLITTAKLVNNQLELAVTLGGVKMPWPFTVTVQDPAGNTLYTVARGTDKDGRYTERFPLGANAAGGVYLAKVASLPGGFTAQAQATLNPTPAAPATLAGNVRGFDKEAISQWFLANDSPIVIAVGSDNLRPVAEQLATRLRGIGRTVEVKPEADVLRKAAYPRVWNPTATLYTPGGEAKAPAEEVKAKLTVSTKADGTVEIRDEAGNTQNSFPPLTLLTVGDGGYLNWSGNNESAYEAGCQLFIGKNGQWEALNATAKVLPTDEAFKARWAKPWSRLGVHAGAYQLPAELPEGYTADTHLIALGDSTSSFLVRVLQASEILPQVADAKYPGPGKALIEFAWSPFKVGKNVLVIAASDPAGIQAGIDKLLEKTTGSMTVNLSKKPAQPPVKPLSR